MNTQLVILAQSVTSTVAIIVLLLLAAGIIGFLTAWLYQKSYFTPIIEKLEEEKKELNKKIDNLINEISDLKVKIGGLEKTLADKEREIEELKNPKRQ